MSNYTKATNFATKDSLTTGNPLKTLSGTELDDEFNAISVANATKANANNAALTGVPVAPTAAADTSTTQLATTAFVTTEANLKADLASPTFTGVPAAPTAAADTSTTQLATTAFVTTEANLKADLAGAAFTGAITTTSTIDGVDIATRDGVLSATTVTADAALPKAGGAMTGAITTNSTFDGRDVAADGVTADAAMPKAGGAFTGAVTTNSTIDGRDVAADGVLATNAMPKAGGTMTGDTLHGDNVKAKFGTSPDLEIYHDGSHSIISDIGAGGLKVKASDVYIRSTSDADMIHGTSGGHVKLYNNGSEKLATTSTGVDISGTVTADGLGVSGNSSPNVSVTSTGGSVTLWSGADDAAGYVGTQSNHPLVLRTNQTERVRIDTSGNVGIGVVPASDWHTSYKALELASSVSLFGNDGASPQTWLCNNMKYDASTGTTYKQAGFASFYAQLQDGSHQFKVAPSGAADAAGTFKNALNLANNGDISFYDTGNTPKFFWDASAESLGIGTSSPSTALEVSGAVTVTRSDVASDNSTISNEGGLFVISAASGGGGGSYPMLFKTVNTEAMRIDTSGNVGIGVTPSTAWHSNHVALQLGGGKDGFISAPKGQNIGRMFMGVNAVSTDATGNNWSRGGDTYRPSLYSQINGVHAFKTAAAGSGAISWDTAMTIDNSGNLLVGTTTKETQGVTLYGSGANGMYLKSTGTCAYMITQSGTGGAGTLQTFYSNTTSVGSITTSGTSTSYNTASDHRLKADVQPMTGATATFMQLNPVNFEWIADGTRVDGFLAHELGEVIPAAATGSKDAMMDEEYEVSPATGDVYTAASAEVATESQVMETVEAGSYVNLAGETIVETEERGVTTDLVETIVQRQDVNGVSTEVEVEVTTKVPTMETVITTPAVAEVIHISDVELPENLEEGQQWRETTAQVMATRSVPDMQGIDQAKVVPLLVATIQELIARIEALEA